MRIFKSIALALAASALMPLGASALGAAANYELSSPDGKITVNVDASGANVSWAVSYDGEQVIETSGIGLNVRDRKIGGVTKSSRTHTDEMLTAVVPTKFSQVRDCYNQLRLQFKGGVALVFRAYDNGVAYRFESSFGKKDVLVDSELAEFNFAPGAEVWWVGEKSQNYITHCEAFFKRTPMAQVGDTTYSYLPLTLKTAKGTMAVITETDLFDYPNMFLRKSGENGLKAEHPGVIRGYDMKGDRDVTPTDIADYIASTKGNRGYPWRVLMLGSDKSLLENTLAWQLASEEVSNDTEWIKPGKISWEWWAQLNVYGVDFKAGVNTETYKYYIDFAAKYGLEYILLDEGWSASTLDITHAKPDLDLQGLIDYGKSKGVGVVLWTLWTPMKADMEHILDVYRDWGVSGIKIDFMQMTDQNMVNFYEDVARECFERHLLVDYHGAYKPAGLQRKYPNAMSFEGVYGMEHDKCSTDISPDHDLVLPFTRMTAGPMDYTPGATINATKDDFYIRWSHPMSQGTRSHQAAIFITYESPVEMLCDSPSNYLKNNDFTNFLSRIPTTWDETVALDARIGEYLTLARRKGDTWYAAGMTNWTGRSLKVDFSFLPEGEYTATIHRDGVNADVWAEDYVLEKKAVDNTTVMDIELAPGGGFAIIIESK